MRRVLPFVLGVVLFSAGAHAAETRVGVVVTGADSSAVGAAQKTLESKLAGPSVSVRGAADLAPVIGGPVAVTANAWASDPVARASFDAALADAKKSYFSDLMPAASAKLEEASAIVERAVDVPGSIRVKVPLWRAAVALRQGQKDAAASEVNVALLLVPNLEVEPNSPPPVVQLVADLRAKLPKPFKVSLAGVPATALVKIDDVVFSPASIAVAPGSHVLDVVAAGFRPFNATIDASADVSMNVALVPSIGPSWETLFEGVVSRGAVSDTERKSLESVAGREKLDFVVLASARADGLHGIVWRRSDGGVQVSPVADADTFAAWAVTRLTAKAVAVVATPRPTPSATPIVVATPAATPTPEVRVPPPAGSFRVGAEAGFGFVRWTRSIVSKQEGYDVPGLSGGGPRVRILAGRPRGVIGEAELSYFTFGSMTTKDQADKSVEVPGGSMLSARLAAGWRLVLGQRDRAPAIIPSVGGFYESYAATDLDGTKVFPSHTRSGAEVRVAATIPAGPATLLVEAGVSPFSTWTEDPDGATGQDPAPSLTPGFRAGLDAPAGPGRVSLDVTGERRHVTYSGTGTSVLPFEEAARTELLLVFGVAYRYHF